MEDESSELLEEEIEEREPQVTSSDPNERKLARKLRIERRLEAIRKLNMPEGEEEDEVVEKTLLQQQLQKSAELLEKLTLEGNELVTNVRVANDSREVDRREEEGIGREKVLEQLEEEAASAEEQFKEIAEKWLSILEYNDPLAINDDIVRQKEKCDELIRQKDEVIAMLRNQIKTAEINFTKDQRKQNEDIETLAKRIEKQVAMMRRAYQQELQLIEDVIMIERKMLIDANDKRWEELHKRRDQEEEMNSDKKFEQLEEFEEMCTKLRVDHQEKYRETKIKLENDIENLQQELEQIKALALMNSEKLDYSYQILKKREDENIIIKSQQKRRINKMQDATNVLRRKISEYTKYALHEIDRLTAEIRKLQASVLDIETKADHFAKINDTKYKQVWKLNSMKARDILNQILATDRVLHEQQLGLSWANPEQTLLDKSDLPSYKSALQVVTELCKKDESSSAIRDKTTKDSAETEVKVTSLGGEGETMAHRRILRIVLQQIADKSGFLLDERLKEILKPYAEHEKAIVRVDCVFSALEIKRKEEVEILLEYFLPYTHCPICAGIPVDSIEALETEIMSQTLTAESSTSSPAVSVVEGGEADPVQFNSAAERAVEILSAVRQRDDVIDSIVSDIRISGTPTSTLPLGSGDSTVHEDETMKPSGVTVKLMSDQHDEKVFKETGSGVSLKMSCQNRHPLVISSVYVLRALREFVCKFYVAKEGAITMSSRLSQKRSTVSRLMVGEDVKMFWDRFKTIFSPAREELWDGLMVGLQKYHEILKDRKKLNDEVMILRAQNAELKHLLSNYKRMEEKKRKPPCALQREVPIKPLVLDY